MTSLDEILHIINSIEVISVIQITPQKINITVAEESFWKIIEVFNKKNLVFKFIEKREFGIDVHLSLSIRRNTLGVSFRVIEYGSGFFSKIKTEFPSSRVYVKELSKNMND